MAKKSSVYVGFLGYGQSTAQYLPDFLASLFQQTYSDFQVVIGDNTPIDLENPNQAIVKGNYPQVEYISFDNNLGFAQGYNHLFNLAQKAGAKYFLVINPDTSLEPVVIEQLVNYLENNPTVAAVMPKILRWDFANRQTTNQVDSLGIAIGRDGRFFDQGQGQIDQNQDQAVQNIFGFTGAGVLLRLSALSTVSFNNGHSIEYFDELMFMYKEDCDLSYRLRLAGWEIKLLPTAIIYHDRTATQVGSSAISQLSGRRHQSRLVRQWSYTNQLIIYFKYRRLPKKLKTRLAEAIYQLKRLIAALFFEPFTLSAWPIIIRYRLAIKNRYQALTVNINPLLIEDWRK